MNEHYAQAVNTVSQPNRPPMPAITDVLNGAATQLQSALDMLNAISDRLEGPKPREAGNTLSAGQAQPSINGLAHVISDRSSQIIQEVNRLCALL